MKNKRGLTILALDVILFFILLNSLPFNEMENRGLALLIFIGILWLTEAFHITVTALLSPIMAVLLNVLNTKEAFAPFANPIIFMFLGGFIIAAILNIQKIDLWIAQRIIYLARGNLKKTVLYLFSVTAGLSLFINNTAVTAMMLPLTLGILRQMEFEQNKKLYVFVLLGVAFSSSIGGIGTLVGSTPNAFLASQLNISFTQWLYYGFPVACVLLLSMVYALLFILKPNFNVQFNVEVKKELLNPTQKTTLIIFAITALTLVLSSFIQPLLSKALNLDQKIANFDAIIAMTSVLILCIANTADWPEIQERTEWGVLLLFGGGLTLSAVLQKTGASKILADTIVEHIGTHGFLLLTLSLTTFIIFLTEFASNTATAALMTPIFISVAQKMGLPEISLAAIVAIGASCAFMLPIATPPNAIVFSTGYIKQKDMVKVGLILNIVCIIVITILSSLLWM